jgi:hypothetical protein
MGILSYGYKAIKNVKPKAISDATKRFKAKVSGIKAGVKKGTDEFQKANPKSLVTDKDIKKIQKETSEKHNKKELEKNIYESLKEQAVELVTKVENLWVVKKRLM